MENLLNEMTPQAKALYNERLNLVDDAIAMKPVSRVPVFTVASGLPLRLYGASWADVMYDYDKAGEAYVKFFSEFKPDVYACGGFSSGKANEISGARMLDWPGRPGGKVPDGVCFQSLDIEYMDQEDYPELLRDYTGFLLRKYIPRAYGNLQGTRNISLVTSRVMGSEMLSPLGSEELLETITKINEIRKENIKAGQITARYHSMIKNMGFPPRNVIGGEVPYDIIGDYFRGVIGIMEDLLVCPDELEAACYMFADLEIERFRNFFAANPDLDVRRIFFPMHNATDGFMSAAQYDRFYWKPFKKMIDALVEMGAVPYLYTEGKYDTRMEALQDVPKGKVLIHFENVDMARAAKMFEGVACICGNMPITVLEYGTKEDVINNVKWLIDTCAPYGGYMFDAGCGLEAGKRENVEVMFDTLATYGKR